MSDYDRQTALSEGYDPEERHQRYPLVKATPPPKVEWPDFELDYEPWEDAPEGMDMPH